MLSGTDQHNGPDDAFIAELSRLKRQGASVLVVGSTRAVQQAETCQQLFGRSTERQRRRIRVTITGEVHNNSGGVNNRRAGKQSIIRHGVQTRSATSNSASSVSMSAEPPIRTETLVDLGVAISKEIDALDAAAGGLEPSELRIGIDSLLPLLEEYGKERVFRFIHLTNGRTQGSSGMIHYHLPVTRDTDVVSVLSPLFDVIVELRERNGICQERWSLKNEALCSGWISTTRE